MHTLRLYVLLYYYLSVHNKSIENNLFNFFLFNFYREALLHSNHITMNWICCLTVFQYTILLLHARPETSTTEKITLETGHPSSYSAMITTSDGGLPSEMSIPDIKKHLAADISISPPSHSIKRVLSTPQMKKIEPSKRATNMPELVTFSSVTTNADAITKTTRYHDVLNRTTDTLHDTKPLTTTKTVNNIANNVDRLQFQNLTKSKLSLLNNASLVREFKQQEINNINRQYLSNAYNLNPYFTQILTTPKTYQTVLAPSSQSQPSYVLFNQNDFNSLGSSIQASGNVLNVGGNNFNPNFVNTESYQLVRPPSSLTVNIPYHEFATQAPPLLYNSANITKMYSVFVSSTPDPYVNYQAIPTKPPLRRKNVSTTHRPFTNHHHHHKNNQHKEQNHSNHKNNQNQNNKKKNPATNFDDGQNNGNKLFIVYNESDQFFNATTSKNPFFINNFDLNKEKNATTNQTIPKECIVSSNSNNPQAESVCKSNDLKIIIKLDGSGLANATEKNEVESKPKRKKTSSTTTVATTDTDSYDSLAFDSDETDDEESDEFSNFLEPIQNIFGFNPSTKDRKRVPNKRKDKPSMHGNKKDEIVNKYQTIILQSPPPPTTTPSHTGLFKKSTFYKILALLPILSVLKPIGFGFWTLALSPILVIAISGVALGVVLYPFFAISRQQVLYASSQRSPKIVIHKHPRPTYAAKPIANGIRVPSWRSAERRQAFNHPNRNVYPHKQVNNFIQQKRVLPIRLRNLQNRSNRRARDTQFQQWLLIQNNFNIRIMSPNQPLLT